MSPYRFSLSNGGDRRRGRDAPRGRPFLGGGSDLPSSSGKNVLQSASEQLQKNSSAFCRLFCPGATPCRTSGMGRHRAEVRPGVEMTGSRSKGRAAYCSAEVFQRVFPTGYSFKALFPLGRSNRIAERVRGHVDEGLAERRGHQGFAAGCDEPTALEGFKDTRPCRFRPDAFIFL